MQILHESSLMRVARRSLLALVAALTVGLPAVAEAAAPVNTGPPSLSPAGTVTIADTLTLTPGTWDATYTVQDVWTRCDSNQSNCSQIAPSGNTYTLSQADVGDTISVSEQATNTADNPATSTTVTSNVVTVQGTPVNNTPPTITGTAAGGTLTEGHGVWSSTPTAYAYQWLSCTGVSASTCTAISGATAQTYVVPAASDGLGYEVMETASNLSGAGSAASSAVLIPPLPVNTVLPVITGTVAVGQVLTASTGAWSNAPTTYAYQWQRCSGSPLACTAISAATAATYTLTSADAGFSTAVQVTATNAGGSASISSAGAALPSPPVLRAPPSIPGTPQQGQPVTEKAAVWANTPTAVTYQWYVCDSSTNNCAAITAATARSYTPTAGDVGGTLQLSETASNAGGSATGYSPFAGPVVPSVGPIQVPASTSPPGITGAAQQGATLTESHATWTGNPGSFSYQWLRCAGGCAAVPGATSPTYTLGPDDVGFALQVQEFAANSGGPGAPATAKPTAVVTATSATDLVAPQRSVTNQPVTLVATVTSSSANATASGSVSFRSAAGPITGCSAVPTSATGQSATVTCPTTFAAATITTTAVFSPASTALLTGSTSPAATIAVTPAATTTHLTAPGQPAVRTTIKYTASVAPKTTPATPIAPSGTLTFQDRGKTIPGCTDRRLVKNTASCQIRYTRPAAHRITARYTGDTNYTASTSPVARVTIGKPTPHYVTSVMQWYVHYTPAYTTFTSWLAYGVPTTSSLYFTCHGHGCPFTTHTLAVATTTRCTPTGKTKPCPTSRTVNLEPIFTGARLGVGTTITISILRCGWYGKHYTLKTRPRHGPTSIITNLPIGVTRPGIKC